VPTCLRVLFRMRSPSATTTLPDLIDRLPQPTSDGASNDPIVLTILETPVGPMLGGAVEAGICLLEFIDRRAVPRELDDLTRHFRTSAVIAETRTLPKLLQRLKDELAAYFRADLNHFSLPLVAPGTPFQTRVWDALNTIPYGQTRAYSDIARQIGQPGAVRAVGAANGANRIAIIIPCHRVIEANGKLRGYGGGLERKRFLLELEQGSGGLLQFATPHTGE
jgi:AraC family transcriptional regulator of adaptative response/methylated-DNA-[protein]-cysteine methyltransferase